MRARAAAILAVCLLLLAAMTVLLGRNPSSSDTDPSSEANGRAGTLALYTWLHELGKDVHRISGSFDLAGTDVLFILAPSSTPDSTDVESIVAHLQGGGDVVVATSGEQANPLLTRMGMAVSTDGLDGTAHNTIPLDAADRVHDVPVQNASRVTGANAVPLLALQGSSVATETAVGAGHLYVVGSAYPVSNAGLRDGDSALFILGLLERARGGKIGFDEVHHGNAEAATAGPLMGIDFVFTGPLLVAVLLGTAVLLIGLAFTGRRLGRPLPAKEPGRVPSVTEYVTSMAHLFERSRRRGPVAARYAEELKQRVGALTGVEWALPDDAFVAALSGHPVDSVSDLAQVLRGARQLASAQPTEAELVALARRVVATERHWARSPATMGDRVHDR